MPGFIPHFIAGHAMFLVGTVLIKKFTTIPYTKQNLFLLYGICIIASIIPDFPLSLYYIFHIGPRETLLEYHSQFHYIITPLASISFIILAGLNIIKKKPIWIMGVFCIVLHIIMDATIEEMNLFF